MFVLGVFCKLLVSILAHFFYCLLFSKINFSSSYIPKTNPLLAIYFSYTLLMVSFVLPKFSILL